jgi:hypothetical protein
MDAAEYLKTRVDEQISWLDKKSVINQNWYKFFRILEIFLAAMLPLLVSFRNEFVAIPVVIGAIGVAIVIMQGLHQLYKFRDNWTEYRAASEALKREKFLFQTGAIPYQREDAFPIFVRNAELIMGLENAGWKYHFAGHQDEADQPKKNPEAA